MSNVFRLQKRLLGGGRPGGAKATRAKAAAISTAMVIKDCNVQVTSKLSGFAALRAAASLHYQKKEKKHYVFLGAGLAIRLGLKGFFEISAGQEYAPEAPTVPKSPSAFDPRVVNTPGFGKGGLPGTILVGNVRVLIG
ncbi:MAG: hypothetical protein EOO60_01575 [Hymenobacter sp.]|nr:MAG: hypothetical protein EOO60_01575 [Hymenobacter sp.]